MKRQLSLDVIRKHQATFPVDVWAIASELGIEVREAPMPDIVSGKIKNEGGYPPRFSIWLNASHHMNRRRFTLAHELAHYILHRDQIEEVVDNVMYRKDGQTLDANEERRANQLAANILMPLPLIKEVRLKGAVTPREFAECFGVSEAAMRIHLGVRPDTDFEEEDEEEDEEEAGAV